MRTAIGLGLVCATCLLTGCSLFHRHPRQSTPPAVSPQAQPQTTPKTIIKPDLRLVGHVAMVNAEARFVIITFPAGTVPAAGQHMNVFRNGFKVGEVKITGPQRESDTVADILAGDAQIHDEARSDSPSQP